AMLAWRSSALFPPRLFSFLGANVQRADHLVEGRGRVGDDASGLDLSDGGVGGAVAGGVDNGERAIWPHLRSDRRHAGKPDAETELVFEPHAPAAQGDHSHADGAAIDFR